MISRSLVAAAFVATVASGASAQRCGVTDKSAWLVKQRAWLNDAAHTWTNDTMRTKLLGAAGIANAPTLAAQYGFQVADGERPAAANEAAVIAELRALAGTRGSTWPTKSVVGAAGVRAVWLLAQRDTALARAALKRMMEAGPEESHAADVATLEDRVRLLSGRKQLYGTQFRRAADGTLSLMPMEDSAHVDLRREDAGLPPFRVSACLARSG